MWMAKPGYQGAGNRYGEGGLAGKCALLSVTTGGPAEDYGPRGINGQLDELLFPITHGTLFSDAPIPYRPQNGGDFPGRHVLADDVAPGVTGLRAHLR
jgi:NAD(P)H dehydrogenase (quinone)